MRNSVSVVAPVERRLREEAAPPPPQGATLGRRARHAVVALGLLLPIALVWSVDFPPQFDAPNHLARHFLEFLSLRGEPLPQGYEVDYRILPNLGGDIVVPLLLCVFEPATAWKLFDSLALLVFWLGPALFLLQQAGPRPSTWAACLLLLPFQMSGAFLWGFLNYYSGVGLAFLVLVHLGRLSRSVSPPLSGLAVHALLLAGLFLWHLAAVVLYGAVAFCLVLERARALRQIGERPADCARYAIRLWLPMVPVALLFAAYSLTSASQPAPPPVWEGPIGKAARIPTLFGGFNRGVELLAVALWAAALLAFFGRSLLRPGRHWFRLATFGLAGLYFLLPRNWRETASVDTRVLPVAMVCLLGWLASTLPLRYPRLGLLLLLLAVVTRTGSIAHAWHGLHGRLEALAPSLDAIPEGSRVLPITLVPGPAKEHPEWHYAAHAVTRRRAFVPTLFAYADQQPLRLTREFEDAWSLAAGTLHVDEGRAREGYDYVWLCNPGGISAPLPAGFERVYSNAGTEVWRIR